jgi:tetratricopeptide (TPR) repeat protein
VAAVLGRHFALSALTQVHPLAADAASLEEQIRAIADSGLVRAEPSAEPSFSFSHAVVQEVAHELLPFNQRRELHHRTAEWLESASGRNLEELSPLLAHHWEQAEAIDKAMHYLEKAGEHALLRDSSDREAEEFLTRLVALADGQPDPDGGPFAKAPMLGSISERSISLARWERLLSQALSRQGRYVQAQRHLERSISLLGQQVPTATLGVQLEFVQGVLRRLIGRPPRTRHPRYSAAAQLALLELSRSYARLLEYQYLGRLEPDVGSSGELQVRIVTTLRCARAAELAGPSAELSRVYAVLAHMFAMCRRPQRAEYYATQARVMAAEVGDRHALFRALRIGQLHTFNSGRWRETTAAFEEAITLASELRLVVEGLLCEHSLAEVRINEGRLVEALELLSNIRRRARREDAVIPQLWACASMGTAAFRLGRLSEAISYAEETLDIADRRGKPDQNCLFQAHGVLASVRLRIEGVDRARLHANRAIAASQAGARFSLTAQSGFLGVAEVLFATWEQGGQGGKDAKTQLRRWLRTVRVMAFHRPIFAPWNLVLRARWSARHGRRRLAIRRLRKAIRLADRMDLAYESAFARAELARLFRKDEPTRPQILDQACRILARIGAVDLLSETRSLLSEARPSSGRDDS